VAFSIIIPTLNRPAILSHCLEALARSDWPHEQFEVVVVDDGGETPLEGVVAPFRDRMTIRLHRTTNGGPGAARNYGARVARNVWLAFTDDDCRPDAGWLPALAELLSGNEFLLVGGSTRNGLPGNACAAASQLVASAAYSFFNTTADARFLASNNMACHRTAFLTAGGFDSSFRIASEDREFCDRWRFLGRRIAYSPAASVYHCHDLSSAGFLRQHFAYGRGAARFHRVRAQRASGSLLSDLSFRWRWRELLLRPAMASPYPFRLMALLAAWQTANTAGFLYEAIRGWAGPAAKLMMRD
jgi:GT2 family glycosyltransferase